MFLNASTNLFVFTSTMAFNEFDFPKVHTPPTPVCMAQVSYAHARIPTLTDSSLLVFEVQKS